MLLSILFSKTLSLHFNVNVRDQIPHPYKVIVLFILVFLFLDSKLEDKRLVGIQHF